MKFWRYAAPAARPEPSTQKAGASDAQVFPFHHRALPVRSRSARLSLAIVGALVVPQHAHASAFQLKEDSALAMGRAYAGSATAGGDVSVVANNPAAMSDLKGTYFEADVTAINFGAKFSGSAPRRAGSPDQRRQRRRRRYHHAGAGACSSPPRSSDRCARGRGLLRAVRLPDRVRQGLGGPLQRASKSKFESLDGTLSASYDVTDNFSLGASAIAQKTSATLTNAINFNTVGLGLSAGPAPGESARGEPGVRALMVPPGTDGYAHIKGNDWA